MPVLISISDVKMLGQGVWMGRLDAGGMQVMGSAASRVGPLSVLLLSERAAFSSADRVVSFSPSVARLLNQGSGEGVLIVESAPVGPDRGAVNPVSGQARVGPGDAQFLSKLPRELRDVGTKLLQAARLHFSGDLDFRERSGKFVETPDNFWTVRIQPRDGSFRITVRGRPQSFEKPRSLSLRPDMTGYSSFKLSSPEQIDEFVRVLGQVQRKA